MVRMLVLLVCISMAATQRNGNVKDRGQDIREIQRQNQITQQIIANFLERRLFPFKRPQHKVPTIAEILPSKKEVENKLKEHHSKDYEDQDSTEVLPNDELNDETDDELDQDEITDPESLQSVESEHVASFYNGNYQDLTGSESMNNKKYLKQEMYHIPYVKPAGQIDCSTYSVQ